MGALLFDVEQRWECHAPGCGQTAVTRGTQPHVRFHTCTGRAGTAGMSVPMTPAGVRCDVRANEREDWIAGELVQVNAAGRPVMNVTIEREDGQDCAVYVPCATLRAGDQ